MIWKRSGRKPTDDIRIMATLFPAAETVARQDGLEAAGAEHLVIAALDLPDGSARRAFERVGATADDFRDAVRAQHHEALAGVGMSGLEDSALDRRLPEPVPAPGPVKTSPSAHKMFRGIVKQVRKERAQLYGAYFVLAAAESQRGTAVRAIRHMGIDPSALAQAARAEIDGSTP